jgi:hypothetical protein
MKSLPELRGGYKMKKATNVLKNFINAITFPFISVRVLIDESRSENLDGSWE